MRPTRAGAFDPVQCGLAPSPRYVHRRPVLTSMNCCACATVRLQVWAPFQRASVAASFAVSARHILPKSVRRDCSRVARSLIELRAGDWGGGRESSSGRIERALRIGRTTHAGTNADRRVGAMVGAPSHQVASSARAGRLPNGILPSGGPHRHPRPIARSRPPAFPRPHRRGFW